MEAAVDAAVSDGGEVLVGGGRALASAGRDACYVEPTIVRMRRADGRRPRGDVRADPLRAARTGTLDEAIALQNGVPQGLASSIFTTDLREAERFLSAPGSDCGIANVNIGTSGAEIGGAFGGEKDTGGGREAGSDAWKAYMRRQTATVNFSGELPLAQGIVFEVPALMDDKVNLAETLASFDEAFQPRIVGFVQRQQDPGREDARRVRVAFAPRHGRFLPRRRRQADDPVAGPRRRARSGRAVRGPARRRALPARRRRGARALDRDRRGRRTRATRTSGTPRPSSGSEAA